MLSPAPTPTAPKQAKRVGGVSAQSVGTSRSHARDCCDGYWIDGNWQHAAGCRYLDARLKVGQYTLADWRCPYGCEGTETPHWITHRYDCPYWNREGKALTPFD